METLEEESRARFMLPIWHIYHSTDLGQARQCESEVVPRRRNPIELGTLIGSQYSNHVVLGKVDGRL